MTEILLICILCLLIIGIVLLYVLYTKSSKTSNGYSIDEFIRNQEQSSIQTTAKLDENFKIISQAIQLLIKEQTESSKDVTSIVKSVNDLNKIMINKKSRGNFGEYQLNHLLSVYAGDNQTIFETQYKLKNDAIGDVALHLPGEEKVMIVDSKFPLENYQTLMDEEISEIEKKKYESLFKQNIKKHINDISSKYINSQTIENAIMFIPSEAIYMFICGNYSDLIDYAHSKHVLITSPTTLIGVVFTLVNITKDFNRNKHIKQLEKDIVAMYDDTNRLNERLYKLEKNIEALGKSFKDVTTSTNKIVNKIKKIHDGAIDNDEEEKN